MRQSRNVSTIALVLATSLVTLGFAPSAGAGVISTESAMQGQERAARIARINTVLARDNVQEQLLKFGVSPEDARARIASLSDSELQTLEQRMDELPAGGGVLEVMGILLVVLLVLELVGITDVFKSI